MLLPVLRYVADGSIYVIAADVGGVHGGGLADSLLPEASMVSVASVLVIGYLRGRRPRHGLTIWHSMLILL